jgi:hypothetical protein
MATKFYEPLAELIIGETGVRWNIFHKSVYKTQTIFIQEKLTIPVYVCHTNVLQMQPIKF